ncbi:hypothetical protein GGU45_000678 [Niabella hirudinis]
MENQHFCVINSFAIGNNHPTITDENKKSFPLIGASWRYLRKI